MSKPLEALIVAREAAAAAIMAVDGVRGPIRNQVERCAGSIPANVAEGAGRSGKTRAYHYEVAYGSAKEASEHLMLAVRIRRVQMEDVTGALELLDRVRAMLWRLR